MNISVDQSRDDDFRRRSYSSQSSAKSDRRPRTLSLQTLDELQSFIAALTMKLLNIPPDHLDRAITMALPRIGQLMEADRASVFTFAGENINGTNEWCAGDAQSRTALRRHARFRARGPHMARIMRGEIVHIQRVRDLPDYATEEWLLSGDGLQSVLAIPIIVRGSVIGVVVLDAWRSETNWPVEMIELLKTTAAIFGSALARRTAEQALLNEKEFFSNVVETMGSLVIVIAPDGTCLRANRAFLEITGYSAAELRGAGWQRVIPDVSREAARRALKSALGGERVHFEGMLLSRNGEQRTILWSGAVFRSSSGRPAYVVVTGIDLTETLLLREQVEQSRRIDSLGRVAATIAHEFNNVLMAIQPSAYRIFRHPSHESEVQRCGERILRAVKRGSQITMEVTRFAQPADPARQKIDARQWLHALVDEMRPVLEERPGRPVIVEEASDAEGPVVEADPIQLHQVFSNLILNAADAMPTGGTITVAVSTTSAHEHLPSSELRPSAWAHWRVTDTGTGIPPAVLDRIFEPLFTTKRQGTGLGLAVAHQIVRLHGGDVSVDTALGRGTTFHVFLPVAAAISEGDLP